MPDDKPKNPAAQALRAIPSAKRDAANLATIQAVNARRELKACTCGQDPHKPGCPVYQRQRQQESRARKQANK